MTICGKPTKRGTPCQLRLNGGKCPTHDCDLSQRNMLVAAAFYRRDRAAFTAQRRSAGKRGYAATGAAQGWEKANEKAREWRLAHPSSPEQWALDVLAQAGLNHFEREYPVLDGSALDLAWPEARMGVEVNGHQAKPSFGETEPRAERHAAKVAALTAAGWQVLVLDFTATARETAAEQLIQFARQAQPQE
jgi:very-short-patch-repair endonuclease